MDEITNHVSIDIDRGLTLSLSNMMPVYLDFMGVVKMYRDGRIVIAEGNTPDDAARAFWEAVRRVSPEFLNK